MKTNTILKIMTSVILLMAALVGQAQDIRYVRQNGTGDGSSWANASGDLQAMIEEFGNQEVGEIWVAAGTYVPTKIFEDDTNTETTDRDKAFAIERGSAVRLYGGFPPSGNPTMADRNLTQNKTILDGKANDPSHPLGALGGAFHVLIAWTNERVVVDGFHITGGNANQFGSIHDFSRSEGGGVVLSANIIFSNNEVYGNASVKGGGVRMNGRNGDSILFQNNKIYNNTAINQGGGIFGDIYGGKTFLNNNLLHSNAAAEGGHTTYFQTSFDAELTLVNNTLYYRISSSGLFQPANYFSFGNGTYGQNKIILRNTVFINESALGPALTFERASGTTGAIEMSYCFIIGDYSLVSGVTADHIIREYESGDHFINSFMNNFHLKATGACIDAGNNDYAEDLLYDLDGNDRVFNETVDIGAYEYTIRPANGKRLYVGDASGDESGSSWKNACTSLARAIDVAMNNPKIEEIWVGEGLFFPHIKIAETDNVGNPTTIRDNAFVLPKNVKIYGGFSHDEEYLEDRSFRSGLSYLSGVSENRADTVYHVVVSAGDVGAACLDGFRIIGGKAGGSGTIIINGEAVERDHGGGICTVNSSPILSNIIILEAEGINGGAISCEKMSPTLSNLSLFDNSAKYGGAIYNHESSPILTNVTITENKAEEGGGIYNVDCPATIIRNTVVWGNKNLEENPDNIVNSNTTPEYAYSLIGGINPEGEGNLNGEDESNDPMFENIEEKIFRAQAGSAILNSGNPDYFASGISPDLSDIREDIIGSRRIISGKIDMGAYQNLLSDVSLMHILVDYSYVFHVENIDTLFQTSVNQYKEELLIEAVPTQSNAIIGGDHGVVSCVEGLNIYYLKVTSDDQSYEQWYRIEVTVPKKPDGIESEEKSLFTCYPNPTNGKLHISSKMEIERIIIYNQLGQSMKETPFNGQSVDMQNYPSGIYFLKAVTRNGKTGTQKVIKR